MTPSFGYTCTVTLKNGDTLKGEVVSETGGFFSPVSQVGIQTDDGIVDVNIKDIKESTCKA